MINKVVSARVIHERSACGQIRQSMGRGPKGDIFVLGRSAALSIMPVLLHQAVAVLHSWSTTADRALGSRISHEDSTHAVRRDSGTRKARCSVQVACLMLGQENWD